MGLPVLVGVLAGNLPAGLMATLGAMTGLYGSERPYRPRALMLACLAFAFALAVALGISASASIAGSIAMVTVIAVAATLLCRAFNTGPPGAYPLVLACAGGTAMASVGAAHAFALVLAGGAVGWLAHMLGALVEFRRPERLAVQRAAEAVLKFIAQADEAARETARDEASLALHQAWTILVSDQSLARVVDATVHRLRLFNRDLNQIYAEATHQLQHGEPVPDALQARLREIVAQVQAPLSVAEDMARKPRSPLPEAGPSLRAVLHPDPTTRLVVLRVGVASLLAGVLGTCLHLGHAYWAVAAAVLILHSGFPWRRTLTRSLERSGGTWVGLLLAAAVLAWHPPGVMLALTIAALQFGIEMLVQRHYAIAVTLITANALLISSGGHDLSQDYALMLWRAVDTTLGCAIGIVTFLLLRSADVTLSLRGAMADTLDAVAGLVPLLHASDIRSTQGLAQRQQVRASVVALVEAFEGAKGGTRADQTAAEALGPAVVSVRNLADRVLGQGWLLERDAVGAAAESDPAAAELRETLRHARPALLALARTLREGGVPDAATGTADADHDPVGALRQTLRQALQSPAAPGQASTPADA